MRLHAVLFPETAYRLEGFTINPKNEEIAPVVSQPHVEVDTSRPLVTHSETEDLMVAMGFAPVQLIHDGVLDDGYYAYLHPVTGMLAHDLHDENVVRLPEAEDLAVIDPHISLVRHGTWAAIKLAEVGYPTPPHYRFSCAPGVDSRETPPCDPDWAEHGGGVWFGVGTCDRGQGEGEWHGLTSKKGFFFGAAWERRCARRLLLHVALALC